MTLHTIQFTCPDCGKTLTDNYSRETQAEFNIVFRGIRCLLCALQATSRFLNREK